MKGDVCFSMRRLAVMVELVVPVMLKTITSLSILNLFQNYLPMSHLTCNVCHFNGGNLHFVDAVPVFEDAKALVEKRKMKEALKH